MITRKKPTPFASDADYVDLEISWLAARARRLATQHRHEDDEDVALTMPDIDLQPPDPEEGAQQLAVLRERESATRCEIDARLAACVSSRQGALPSAPRPRDLGVLRLRPDQPQHEPGGAGVRLIPNRRRLHGVRRRGPDRDVSGWQSYEDRRTTRSQGGLHAPAIRAGVEEDRPHGVAPSARGRSPRLPRLPPQHRRRGEAGPEQDHRRALPAEAAGATT